jgi:hypothetical protein
MCICIRRITPSAHPPYSLAILIASLVRLIAFDRKVLELEQGWTARHANLDWFD